MNAVLTRRVSVSIAIGLALVLPALLTDYYKSLAAQAAVIALLVLSLNLLTGFVGQISFCQYSFAALGAFTVGTLNSGHHWNYWLALLVGVLLSALGGLLVGIPALRLSGLFLAILTIGVALFFDRFLIACGTAEWFAPCLHPWELDRPSLFGLHLTGEYPWFLVTFGIFLLAMLLVWNLRTGKTGRVLRAIRESEIAASTVGLDLTRWKLAAFAVSAGLAGLAGGLLAATIGSVSAGAYDFLHSITVAAVVTVMGVGSLASAAAGGIFIIWGNEFLRHTPLGTQYFPLFTGGLLIVQLVFRPQGAITSLEHDLSRAMHLVRRGRSAEVEPIEVM